MKADRIILAILIVCLIAMPSIASERCQDEKTVVDGAGRTVRICPSANLIVRKRIYFIQDDLTSGPKQVIGLLWMAKWFYPDHFSDMDPEVFHKAFYEQFMRLPYRGVHLYPGKKTGETGGRVGIGNPSLF